MSNFFQKISLILLLGMTMSSCGNSKFNDTVSILESLPVFIADQKVEQKVVFTDNTITITIPDQGQLSTKDGEPVTDDMIITAFLQDMFNNELSTYIIGSTLDTKQGGSPVEEFISIAEKEKVNFIIEYNNTKITLTPKELSNKLKGI